MTATPVAPAGETAPACLASRWGLDADRFWLHGRSAPQPVAFDEQIGAWCVYGHPEAVEVLELDTEFSSDSSRLFELDEQTAAYLDGDLTQMAGAEHLHLREQVSAAFTGKAMARLRERILSVTEAQLDQLGDSRSFDLLTDLVRPVSGIVFTELLGIPAADRSFFDLIDATMDQDAQLTTGTQDSGGTDEYLSGLTTPLQPLRDMLGGHIDERLRNPRTDLLGLLTEVRSLDGERLTREQIINFVIGILGAGHLSTPMLIGNTVLCLDAFPDQRALVLSDRSVLPAAFEETMRYLTPANATYRATTCDTSVAGTDIGANQLVRVWLGAANRDARVFPEPHRYDATRHPNPHLGFGHGNHFCLGKHMIALESELVINRIFDRFPGLAVNPDIAPAFFGSPDFTGVKSLTVRA